MNEEFAFECNYSFTVVSDIKFQYGHFALRR